MRLSRFSGLSKCKAKCSAKPTTGFELGTFSGSPWQEQRLATKLIPCPDLVDKAPRSPLTKQSATRKHPNPKT